MTTQAALAAEDRCHLSVQQTRRPHSPTSGRLCAPRTSTSGSLRRAPSARPPPCPTRNGATIGQAMRFQSSNDARHGRALSKPSGPPRPQSGSEVDGEADVVVACRFDQPGGRPPDGVSGLTRRRGRRGHTARWRKVRAHDLLAARGYGSAAAAAAASPATSFVNVTAATSRVSMVRNNEGVAWERLGNSSVADTTCEVM